ncbi:ComE operon protein 1 [compost metagenome]
MDKAIDIAGGVTNDADIAKLNLSQKLVDSDKILIPKRQIVDTQNDEVNENSQLNKESSKEDSTEKININIASEEELLSLNGIGKSTAKKIIEYRKNNKFIKIEDIMNVSGIGQAKYNSIKDSISVK